jgi:hypothetical protein
MRLDKKSWLIEESILSNQGFALDEIVIHQKFLLVEMMWYWFVRWQTLKITRRCSFCYLIECVKRHVVSALIWCNHSARYSTTSGVINFT